MERISSIKKGAWIISSILVGGFLGTWILNDWDIAWPSLFYAPGGINGGWVNAKDFPWGLLYGYGEYPALILGFAALCLYLYAKAGKVDKKYCKPCLVVILTLVIGPGLVVNGLLKNFWGRPRPAETSLFGGDREYRKAWPPGRRGEGKSFPCGHCSMGFSFASGAAFYSIHPAMAVAATATGIVFGTLLGIARIVQGGHFPTDVLWSGLIVWIVIAALYYIIFQIPETETAGSQET